MSRRVIAGIIIAVIALILFICLIYFWNRSSSNELVLFGNVDVRQVDLGFRTNGRVIEMPFEEGDFVPKDALMAVMDKQPYEDQVRQAVANIESVKTSLANQELILNRRQRLVNGGGVSEEDYQNALSSRDVFQANLAQAEAALGVAMTDLRNTQIYAPTDGIILTRIREPGTVVTEGTPVYTMTVISPVWIRAFVSEPELGLIYPGMEANIYTDTPGGKVYHGRIGFISPVSEFTPKTVESTSLRTDLVYRIRVYADNPDHGLRQGMPVTVKLPLDRKQQEKK